ALGPAAVAKGALPAPTAACSPQGPPSSSGTFRSAVGSVRRATPGASVAYMTEVLSALWPRPRAWPSSCITIVSTSYWPDLIWLGSAVVYQSQPDTRVICPGLSQP